MDDVNVQPLDLVAVDVGSDFEDLGYELRTDFEDLGYELQTDFESSGSVSYETLKDKPKIEGRTLSGEKTFAELGLSELSNLEFLQMYNDIVRS